MSYIVPQKMPSQCFECGLISLSTIDGYGCKITHRSLESEHGITVRRPDWCPLVEIPDLIEYGNNLISLHKLYPQEMLNIYEQAIKDMQDGISELTAEVAE